MIGNNDMTLNTATMIEAIQYYFDNVLLKKKVKVTNIKSGSSYSTPTFIVEITEVTDENLRHP